VVGDAPDLDTYLAVEHLLVSPEGNRFGHADAKLAWSGRKRSLGLTISQMHPAPAVVAGSDLTATPMRGVVEVSGWSERLRILDPPLPLEPRSSVMSRHRRNDAHSAEQWLRSCLQIAAGSQGSPFRVWPWPDGLFLRRWSGKPCGVGPATCRRPA